MNRNELKEGMICEFRDGDRGIVIGNYVICKTSNIAISDLGEKISRYKDKYDHDDKFCDIVKVFKLKSSTTLEDILSDNLLNENYVELFWQEEEDLNTKVYKLSDLIIKPNGKRYSDDENEEIFIEKEDWSGDKDYMSISVDEAKKLIKVFNEIIETIESNRGE